MNNKLLNIKEFIIPIYGSTVIFIVFKNTWNDVIKHLENKGFNTKEYKDYNNVDGLQLSENINGKQYFVIIAEKNKSIKETIVHELFHLTQDILEYKGIDFKKNDANESYAYLIGALYTIINKLLKE